MSALCAERIYRKEKNMEQGTFTKQVKFIVYNYGKVYDEVFYAGDMTPDEVKKSLVDHDGYPPTIEVVKT